MDPNRSTAWADPLVMKAQQVAADAHKGQKRKHSNDPYLIHPMRVARRVMTRPDATPEMVAAAWLHDVVEDTPVTLDEIGKEFGSEIAQLVRELTNASEGSRAPRKERKAMDRAKLAARPRSSSCWTGSTTWTICGSPRRTMISETSMPRSPGRWPTPLATPTPGSRTSFCNWPMK